jgi:hypothetical protein
MGYNSVMKNKNSGWIGLLVLIILGAIAYVYCSRGLVITAVGDYGANVNTFKALKVIREIDPSLHLLLGDLSYDQVKPESAWCDVIKKELPNIPLLTIAGNHESDGRNGDIDKFLACLPKADETVMGDYGKEYYVDYPTKNPIIRFVFISPDLIYTTGETYSYAKGTAHRKWVEETIADAKTKNIPWIIPAMHKVCISGGDKGCEIGEEFTNYLIQNSDLILQGHSHTYQRTKQLTCAKEKSFDPGCVVASASNKYEKGKGSVLAIVGTGGAESRVPDTTDVDSPYFQTQLAGLGTLKIKVTKDLLKAWYVNEYGTWDSFTIKSW